MLIEYFHDRNNYKEHTYAVEIPPRDLLLEQITLLQPHLNILFGKTTVNPKDNYNKKLGRELAKRRMNINNFILLSINFENDKWFFMYTNDKEYVTFSFTNTSNKVRLEVVAL